MKIKVQVVIESDGGDTKAVENMACLERQALRPSELGLTLAEAKDELQVTIQQCYPRFVQQERPLKKAVSRPRFFSLFFNGFFLRLVMITLLSFHQVSIIRSVTQFF